MMMFSRVAQESLNLKCQGCGKRNYVAGWYCVECDEDTFCSIPCTKMHTQHGSSLSFRMFLRPIDEPDEKVDRPSKTNAFTQMLLNSEATELLGLSRYTAMKNGCWGVIHRMLSHVMNESDISEVHEIQSSTRKTLKDCPMCDQVWVCLKRHMKVCLRKNCEIPICVSLMKPISQRRMEMEQQQSSIAALPSLNPMSPTFAPSPVPKVSTQNQAPNQLVTFGTRSVPEGVAPGGGIKFKLAPARLSTITSCSGSPATFQVPMKPTVTVPQKSQDIRRKYDVAFHNHTNARAENLQPQQPAHFGISANGVNTPVVVFKKKKLEKEYEHEHFFKIQNNSVVHNNTRIPTITFRPDTGLSNRNQPSGFVPLTRFSSPSANLRFQDYPRLGFTGGGGSISIRVSNQDQGNMTGSHVQNSQSGGDGRPTLAHHQIEGRPTFE